MPIFEYICRRCEHQFEKLVFGSNTPPCPHCGATDVQKRMSGFSFRSTGRDGVTTKSSSSSCGTCSRSTCSGCH
ncbi:MAG TPA: zinc ribbon domain-containing protein [bacterium]|nr:zinc ribbon domain-containing protein [bacterium]